MADDTKYSLVRGNWLTGQVLETLETGLSATAAREAADLNIKVEQNPEIGYWVACEVVATEGGEG